MNKLIAAIVIIALNLGLSQFLPWWNFIPIVFLVVLITKLKASSSWVVPALSLMLLWLVQIFLTDQKTGFRSSERIAAIFESPGVVAYLVPVIGVGLLAALSGIVAYLLRTSFQKKNVLEKSEMHLDDYQETQPDLKDKGIV